MGEDGNRMTDREALTVALLVYENEIMVDPVVVTALKERLAQLPETCGTCLGGGRIDAPVRLGSGDPSRPTCHACHGKGVLYPPALVERIAEHLVEVIEHFNEVDVADIAVAVLDALNTETP